MIDPVDALIVLGTLWLLLLTIALILMLRHLNKVDDLAAEVSDDLADVERQVQKLKPVTAPATTMAIPVVRTYPEAHRAYAETGAGTQSTGRHARPD